MFVCAVPAQDGSPVRPLPPQRPPLEGGTSRLAGGLGGMVRTRHRAGGRGVNGVGGARGCSAAGGGGVGVGGDFSAAPGGGLLAGGLGGMVRIRPGGGGGRRGGRVGEEQTFLWHLSGWGLEGPAVGSMCCCQC